MGDRFLTHLALEDVLVRGDPDVVAVPGHARPDPFANSLGDRGGGRNLSHKFKMEA